MSRVLARLAKPATFPIVGIGASAGGLDASQKFFRAMPPDADVAFVLIQHLDSTRDSVTAELVATHTAMPVTQVRNGLRIEPNHVYVIPPNKYLSVRAGMLRLTAPGAPRNLRKAIDFFLHSLAVDRGEQAIGVILAGTGTDGSLGLTEIKAAGGMTMVQDPATVQHDGMPRSAIATGSADYVLPAEAMAQTLLRHVRRDGGPAPAAPDQDPLVAAVRLVRAHAQLDFSGYKTATLQRRIHRRMSLKHLDQMAEYVAMLEGDPAEAVALSKDLMISVTSFFREPAAWQVLQEEALRPAIAAKAPNAPLRLWVPACATGEEAYSLAIVAFEEIAASGYDRPLQVFATDVDADALEVARAGSYPEGISAHVTPERLTRFFVKDGHRYRVTKALREAVVFAPQSLLSDPPFSRLDLISCRNLFIYLDPAAQERLIPLLHFALVDGGHLFLGSAESIATDAALFAVVSAKRKIYRRVGTPRPGKLHFPITGAPLPVPGLTTQQPRSGTLAALAQRLLLERYAPACVIIDRAKEILYFHGPTDLYLAQPSGAPTRDLGAQLRTGLGSKLRSAVRVAIAENRRVLVAGQRVRRGDAFQGVTTTIEPLEGATDVEPLWLVSFEDDRTTSAVPDDAARDGADTSIVSQLEDELKITKADLQQTIEDLRAVNEEMLSVNEELQSSGEEMETSTEELHSLNEQLSTTNNQLESKVEELEATNDDLDNLLTSTNIATVFLDTELRIRRFTPASHGLFSLTPSDRGRPIADVAQKFTDPRFLSDVAAILHQPSAAKAEVLAHDGCWYIRQVLPYRTRSGRIEGVVITFSDVAAEALHEARSYAESIVDTVREPLLVLDDTARVLSANQSFYATFRVSKEDTAGRSLYELGHGEWDIPQLRKLIGEILPQHQVLNDFEVTNAFESIGLRTMLLNARVLHRGGSRPELILLALEDVTERQRAQEALRESETRQRTHDQMRHRQGELAHALRITTIGELASGLAHELNQPLSAIANGVDACTRWVRSSKETSKKKLLGLLNEAAAEALRASEIVEHLRGFIRKGEPRFESADLREIARVVPRLLAHEIARARITFKLVTPSRPLPIRADRIQIEQVAVNLIQNAINAIREVRGGRREIQVMIKAAQSQAEFSVSDTGIGVSAEASKRLFEPFFTTKSRGLGMGLAISRSIIVAHSGRMCVEPAPAGGRGTTVSFSLPLRTPKPTRKARP